MRHIMELQYSCSVYNCNKQSCRRTNMQLLCKYDKVSGNAYSGSNVNWVSITLLQWCRSG